ncbi:MAG TPA: glucose-6-phosphate dehydrogenase [Gemmataceae bacterium]|jgi:glucose-6-phosphate 1-dehydrogenase
MSDETQTQSVRGEPPRASAHPADPCLLVLFGASGDLTKRLLMPALYNMAADGLLPERFAVIGVARDELTSEAFRERLTADVHRFATRQPFDPRPWELLAPRLHYISGEFADLAAYQRLAERIGQLDAEYQTGGNLLIYLATPPAVFSLISTNLDRAGFRKRSAGWTRIIIEKPFGHDLASALALNREVLAHWREEQIYRIDHYLGKETVQNLLAFRFANGIFEPLWNKSHIDHIQFTVAETVGVEGRGAYYDGTGVLRDMIQNHMFQMLAYLCMEPPSSFRPEAIRNEKAKLLEAVRRLKVEDVVRGQYGPGKKADGTPAVGYRQEPQVAPQSRTETFAALRLFIDNWRWEGVPIYLRSGKALWKRGTEIIVQFRRAPEVIFRDTPTVGQLESNKLLFHIQPDQGIEFRFHAKTPGASLYLQKVNMRFDYREAFEASRGTGYEILLYNCMAGDATLFSRTDLVETAWQIVQPVLDNWAQTSPEAFPNYPAGSWGPKAVFDLIERDGRRWVEMLNRDALEAVPLFRGHDPVLLRNLAMMLRPVVYSCGEYIIRKGDEGSEMYFLCRGQAEVLDDAGERIKMLEEGDYFGELSLLYTQPRSVSIRASAPCDLFVLSQADLQRILQDHPRFAASLRQAAQERYGTRGGEVKPA